MVANSQSKIDLETSEPFQRWEWRIQRVGWIVWSAVLVTALFWNWESVFRGAVTYLFMWLVFRLAGKRTLAQITTFDAVLLLIVSETTQAALVGSDHSMTNTAVLVLTLVGIDISLSFLKQLFPTLEHVMDGTPLPLVEQGRMREHALRKERVTKEDILHAARQLQGIGTLDEIDYAILEQSGGITIIPKSRQQPSEEHHHEQDREQPTGMAER